MSAVAIAAAMTPSANQIGSCGSRLSMLQPRYAPSKYRADSSGRRNMMFVGRPKQLIKCLGRCFPCKRLSGTGVEGGCHGCNRLGAVHAEVGAFGKVLAQQPIGILGGGPLPWAVRIAEVDLYAGVKLEACMLGHFSALIPSQRPTQFLRQGDDRARNGVAHRLGTISGEWGPFFTRASWPWPVIRGRCSSRVKRVVRSTRVPIAELPRPRMRSPSQWPGTARSAASTGR